MHLAATNVSLPLDGGVFDCPHCQARRRYVRRREEAYVSVCWVPIVPVGEGADYVECLACGGAFGEQTLRPRKMAAAEEFAERIVRLLVLVMIRDGKAAPAEIAAILKFGSATLGHELHEADVWSDIRAAQVLQAEALCYAQHLRGLLAPRQRELALDAAAFVLAAGETHSPRDDAYLRELAARLGVV